MPWPSVNECPRTVSGHTSIEHPLVLNIVLGDCNAGKPVFFFSHREPIILFSKCVFSY